MKNKLIEMWNKVKSEMSVEFAGSTYSASETMSVDGRRYFGADPLPRSPPVVAVSGSYLPQ